MKKFLLIVLSLVAALSVTAKNIKHIKILPLFSLERYVGDDIYDVDSLILEGRLYERDFGLLRNYIEKGRLTGLDISRCNVTDNKIPSYAFYPSIINGAKGTRAESNEVDKYYTNLQYVKLPYNLKRIGEKAFARTNLRMVELPRALEEIGDGAFDECQYLESISVRGFKSPNVNVSVGKLSDDITLRVPVGCRDRFMNTGQWNGFNIEESANCFITATIHMDGSKTVTELLGDKVNKLDSVVITGQMKEGDVLELRKVLTSSGLTGVNMGNCKLEMNELVSEAFYSGSIYNEDVPAYDYQLHYITLPEGIEKIGAYAFQGSLLRSINLPSTVKEIEFRAFAMCRELRGMVELPEGMTSVESYAFADSPLLSVYIPSTLARLAECCFWFGNGKEAVPGVVYCNRLNPPVNNSVDVLNFDSNEGLGTWTLYVPMGAKENYLTSENGQWKYFGRIIETPELTGITDGIGNAVADVATEGVEVYTADGRMVSKGKTMPSLGKGLYIVKKGGEAKKVFIGR